MEDNVQAAHLLPSLNQYPQVFVPTAGISSHENSKTRMDDLSQDAHAVNPLSSRGQAIFTAQPQPLMSTLKDPLIRNFGEY
jgi:hypothetical protein